METNNEDMRNRLLGRLPQPSEMGSYRAQVEAALQKNQRGFKREKIAVSVLWVFLSLLATAMLTMGGRIAESPRGAWMGTMACSMLIWGGVELTKHFINRARVEVLREVKQLQLQVLELNSIVQGKGGEQ